MTPTVISATIPAQMQFACGHAALVSLPRMRGESVSQRNARVSREKIAARSRPCDFCESRADSVIAVAETVPSGARASDKTLLDERVTVVVAAEDGSALRDGGQADRTPHQEELMMDHTSTASSPSVLSVDGSDETTTRAKGVFPAPRKLSDEQERELTRLYVETTMPTAAIARTFAISEPSVGRVAQRNGAAPRRRGAARAGARREQVSAATESAGRAGEAGQRRRRAGAAGPRSTPSRRGLPTAADSANPQALSQTVRPPSRPTTQAASHGATRRFRIRFAAERVIEGGDMREALGQAEALGATDIISIARED